MTRKKNGKIEVRNVLHPGRVRTVDADMYEAMREAVLKVLPSSPPGLTLDEARERIGAHLPEDLYPGGAKAGWWFKTVQLDLEARGVIARDETQPLTLRKL